MVIGVSHSQGIGSRRYCLHTGIQNPGQVSNEIL